MTSHLCGGVAPFLRQAQQLPGDLVRLGQFASLEVEHRMAVQDRKDLRDVAQVAAQLASPGVGATRLRSRKSLGGNGGPAESELQAKFALLPLGPVGRPFSTSSPLVRCATASAIAERASACCPACCQ